MREKEEVVLIEGFWLLFGCVVLFAGRAYR